MIDVEKITVIAKIWYFSNPHLIPQDPEFFLFTFHMLKPQKMKSLSL